MKKECDVLVVGAGPAGLTASAVLAKNNLSTLLIEKEPFTKKESVKFDITEGTRIKPILKKLHITPHKISSRSEWISPNQSFLLDSGIQDYYFIRGNRENAFEKKILTLLEKTQTQLFDRATVSECTKNGGSIDTVRIHTNKEELLVKPHNIIVAEGTDSDFTTMLKIQTQTFMTIQGYGAVLQTKQKEAIPHAKIYFDSTIAPGGYIYSGSIGRETFFCIVTDDLFSVKNQKQNLETFIKNHFNEQYQIHQYFTGTGQSGIQNVVEGNTLFVGAAALFHDPFLGYGLNYAIESGYTAAQAIAANNVDLYQEYAHQLQKEFHKMKEIREIWRNADNKFFDKLIKSFNGEIEIEESRIQKILTLFEE